MSLWSRERVVVLEGHVDLANIAELRAALSLAAAEERGAIVVDCGGVTGIDVNGLAVLVGVQRRLQDEGRSLRLRNVGDVTRQMLRRSGLDQVLEVEAAVAQSTS